MNTIRELHSRKAREKKKKEGGLLPLSLSRPISEPPFLLLFLPEEAAAAMLGIEREKAARPSFPAADCFCLLPMYYTGEKPGNT